jgi:hypothetical protein
MSEIFDIIVALNKLKEQVYQLSVRLDTIIKNPDKFRANKFYDEYTVCKLLQVNYRSLLRLRNNGFLPFFRFNRHVVYLVSDIEKFITQNKINNPKSS